MSLFSINFESSDLIGATHIPVEPRFFCIEFSQTFFEGHGAGTVRIGYVGLINH